MEYIFSLSLLVLNLIDYEHDFGHPVFTFLSVVLFSLLFYFVYKKSKSFLATCLIVMCHTWQISWINIFGDPTADLQLPWFYIIGVFIVAYGVVNFASRLKKEYNVIVLVTFVAFLLFFNYPILISKSIKEGMKEYIMIGFYVVVLLVAYIFKDEIPKTCYNQFKSAFIFATVTSSALIVFQYVMFKEFGIALFKIRKSIYLTKSQLSCYLLMEDHSCSTIMLGCGVFYVAERITKKRWFVYLPALFIIFVSMAVTSRRTSTFVLMGVIFLYVFFHYKGAGKKILFTSLFSLAVLAMIYYLLIVRPVDNLSQAVNDNGRYANYRSAIELILKHPFGVGYDIEYLVTQMADGIVPHNTLLRWTCMGGVLFPIPLIIMIGYTIRVSIKKKMSCEFWAILYSLLASNFIPDILNARFFIIPCAAVFLFGMNKIENKNHVPEST